MTSNCPIHFCRHHQARMSRSIAWSRSSMVTALRWWANMLSLANSLVTCCSATSCNTVNASDDILKLISGGVWPPPRFLAQGVGNMLWEQVKWWKPATFWYPLEPGSPGLKPNVACPQSYPCLWTFPSLVYHALRPEPHSLHESPGRGHRRSSDPHRQL